MKIQNADSRDQNWNEVHVICKTKKEFSKAYSNLNNAGFNLNLEDWDEDQDIISVSCDRTDYATKADFIKDIRKIAKK